MILRAEMDVRLKGRRREPVPTRLLDGLANLLVTGFFSRWAEVSPIAPRELCDRLQAELAGARWTPGDAPAAEPGTATFAASWAGDGAPLALTATAHERHAWGQPTLEIELTLVPLPAQLAAAGTMEPEEAGRLVHQVLGQARERQRLLASAAKELSRRIAAVAAACRATLPVEQVSQALGLVVPQADSAERFPGLAGLWLNAVAAETLASPQLAGEMAGLAMDGGGTFGESGLTGDGGGHFDAGGTGASGGGSL